MKLEQIKSVTSKIEQGRWVRNLPNLPGVAVKVRGFGNSDHRRIRAKMASESTTEQLEDPTHQDHLQAEALQRTILVDWSGIEDFPYSPAAAEKILHDPEMAVFRAGVEWAASNVADVGVESLDAERKN